MGTVQWCERWRRIDAVIRELNDERGHVLRAFHVNIVAERAGLPVSVVRRVGLSNAMQHESMRARYDNGMFHVDGPSPTSTAPEA